MTSEVPEKGVRVQKLIVSTLFPVTGVGSNLWFSVGSTDPSQLTSIRYRQELYGVNRHSLRGSVPDPNHSWIEVEGSLFGRRRKGRWLVSTRCYPCTEDRTTTGVQYCSYRSGPKVFSSFFFFVCGDYRCFGGTYNLSRSTHCVDNKSRT